MLTPIQARRILSDIHDLERAMRLIEARLPLLSPGERATLTAWLRDTREGLMRIKRNLGVDGLGYVVLISSLLAAGAALGVWLGVRKQEADAQLRYLECLERLTRAGYSNEQASEICRSEAVSLLAWMRKNWPWLLAGTIAVAGLFYLSSKESK